MENDHFLCGLVFVRLEVRDNFLTKISQPLNVHTNTGYIYYVHINKGQIRGLLVVILVNAVHLFSIVRNRNECHRNGDLKGLTLIFDKYDELKQFAASIKNKLNKLLFKIKCCQFYVFKIPYKYKKDSHEP